MFEVGNMAPPKISNNQFFIHTAAKNPVEVIREECLLFSSSSIEDLLSITASGDRVSDEVDPTLDIETVEEIKVDVSFIFDLLQLDKYDTLKATAAFLHFIGCQILDVTRQACGSACMALERLVETKELIEELSTPKDAGAKVLSWLAWPTGAYMALRVAPTMMVDLLTPGFTMWLSSSMATSLVAPIAAPLLAQGLTVTILPFIIGIVMYKVAHFTTCGAVLCYNLSKKEVQNLLAEKAPEVSALVSLLKHEGENLLHKAVDVEGDEWTLMTKHFPLMKIPMSSLEVLLFDLFSNKDDLKEGAKLFEKRAMGENDSETIQIRTDRIVKMREWASENLEKLINHPQVKEVLRKNNLLDILEKIQEL